MHQSLHGRLLVLLLATFAAGFLLSCARSDSPDLLAIIDVVPRDVEVGDQIEVLGTRLPSGDVKAATVKFDGKLYRPGQEPVSSCPGGSCITVSNAKPSPDKVSFAFTEALQAQFCGKGDKAQHTTFRGDIIVIFPSSVKGGRPVQGKISQAPGANKGFGVTLDFRPPSTRRVVMESRTKEGRAALEHFGIVLADTSPGDGGGRSGGGLKVAEVKTTSPARNAGMLDGDVIVSFGGVTVLSVADMVPRAGQRTQQIGIKRGNAEPFMRHISIAGFKAGSLSGDFLAALIILGVAVLIILLFMAPTAGIITWVERRVAGRMQSRIGPNRAGPQGFLIWLADGIKSVHKEDIVPKDVDEPLFRLAPYLVFIGVSATFVVMPFGQYLIAADLDIGILFVIAVTSLVAIGLMTGGWASNNKWSLLGGIRAAAQVISYEIPAAVAIVCIVMMTGSLRMQEIIQAQGGLGETLLSTGGWPWYWFMFRNPVTFFLFFLFFITALAEGNRAPFDMPEAESELIAGYGTEYSGMRNVFFLFAEWANVFVFCGIAAALFLGGWQLPGVTPGQQEASTLLQVLGVLMFLLKCWILIFVVIWVRWTLPRIRIDQLMNLCWKWLVPLAFAAFMLTGLWVIATSPVPVLSGGVPKAGTPVISEFIQTAIGVAMFAVWLVLLGYFGMRVAHNLKESKQPLHLNPFL